MKKNSYIYLICIFGAYCSSTMLKEEEITNFNINHENDYFEVISDIYLTFKKNEKEIKKSSKPVFKSGEKVRIVLEQDVGWIKVRAFPVKKATEQSEGKIILYIIQDFLPDEELPYRIQNIKTELNKILRRRSR